MPTAPAVARFHKLVDDISRLYADARRAQVQFAWETGRLIIEEEQNGTMRAQYGKELLPKLSRSLTKKYGPGFSENVLLRMRQFFLLNRIPPTSVELDWSDYVELLPVKDEKTRKRLERRILKEVLNTVEIRQLVREIRDLPKPARLSYAKLIPRRGELYTYRLIGLEPVHKDAGTSAENLRVDLGFKGHCQLPGPAKGLKAGQIIESIKDNSGNYEVRPSQRKEADLFTFKARVERVVDGDTLYVDVDQGFGKGEFQYLRLRGIDAPEIDTPEGKKAKAFVERSLAKVPYIILTSSRSDKWDRYLADVWIPATSDQRLATEKDIYLNQLLLDEGHAERWE